MKNKIILTVGFVSILSMFSYAQSLDRRLTEDFKAEKDSCEFYAYQLETFLKPLFYNGVDTINTTSDEVKRVIYKFNFLNTNVTQYAKFIIEIRLSLEWEGDIGCPELGIIEVGYHTSKEAEAIYDKIADQNLLHVKIPPVNPPFRQILRGKSILFVYISQPKNQRFFEKIKEWYPQKI